MGQGRPGFSPPASALAEPGVELCVLLLPRVPPRPQPPRTGRPPRRYLVRPERCRLIDRPVPTAPRSHPSQREDCRRLVTRLTRPHCRRSSHRPGASPAPAPSPPPTAQTPAGTAGTARAIGVSSAATRGTPLARGCAHPVHQPADHLLRKRLVQLPLRHEVLPGAVGLRE